MASVIGVVGACALAACSNAERAGPVGALPAAGAAGLASDAQGGQSGAGGGAGQAGNAGNAGASSLDRTAGIAGRWAMFTFADPVGVNLTQRVGVLSGQGCASGVPPFTDDLDNMRCGAAAGRVIGQQASFGFSVQSYYYEAETTVSADGTRMTGRFRGTGDWLPYPMAWVHIADGQAWLPPDMDLLPNASYDLQLTESDLGAAEYVPNKTYLLHFSDGSIGGDLGSFAFREIGQVAPGTPLNVGPVAMTVPELPVSMVIQVQDQQFTEIETVTGSGHHYTFSAVPSAQ